MPNESAAPAAPAVAAAAVAATQTPASAAAPAAVVAPAPAAVVAPDPAAIEAAVKAQRPVIEKELRTAVEKEQLDKFTAAAKDQVSKWETAAKTDPEIGGDKFDANIVAAKSVLGKFGNEAFTKYLNETGLGSHPEMIRMMIKIAKEFGEDKLLAGGAGAGQAQAKSTAEVLYPNQAAPRK